MKYFTAQLMRKIVIILALLTTFPTKSGWADAINELKDRLNKVDSFYARFTHKVMDGNGNLLQENHGDIWVKRPNLFNCHITKPDESILISDGTTLWVYNPFVEQAIAMWLKDATSDIPFILIARNQLNDWQQYKIKQTVNDFELIPKNFNGNIKKLTITVNKNGTIIQFTSVEQDEQRNNYQFDFQRKSTIDRSKFTFTPLQGIMVDDQRN